MTLLLLFILILTKGLLTLLRLAIANLEAPLVTLRVRRIRAVVELVIAGSLSGGAEVGKCVAVDGEGTLGVAAVGDGGGGFASQGSREGLQVGAGLSHDEEARFEVAELLGRGGEGASGGGLGEEEKGAGEEGEEEGNW